MAHQRGGWIPRGGLGQTGTTTQQINQIATTGATATVSILVALGTITGPVGAAIAGLVVLASQIASIFKGCGQTCVEATAIANQVEPVLKQNLQTYLAAPVHYQSMQAAALNTFQTAWNSLDAACGNASLAKAGQNCISDRQQGSCAYKTSPGGWQQTNGVWNYVYPGANNSGSSCWNWWVGYHDPIANDPTVVPDPAPASAVSSVTSGVTVGATSLLSSVGINPSSTLFGIPLSSLALPALALLVLLLVED
jgi:hypothetical protein